VAGRVMLSVRVSGGRRCEVRTRERDDGGATTRD